jgi:hypothetical protein
LAQAAMNFSVTARCPAEATSTVDGRACGDDWLTFVELAAGGALAYCTGTTPDTGWVAGPAATPSAYCAR